MLSHRIPPRNAMKAAVAKETGQPHWSAIQGVMVGETAPPMFAPIFIKPERLPAWVRDRSLVEDQ
jgi:hypothetical protein